MHPEARDFTLFVKSQLPEFFVNKSVLDVGSGDINGNNRVLFDNCSYEGNDVFQANNVTVLSKTSALPFTENTFDTIISTECFEHDPEYSASFQKIVSMLKPGGLFLFTCASTGRPEHGTRRTSPNDSYGTIGNVEGWTDYYKNLTFEDFKTSIDINVFSQYAHYYNSKSKDLYFWGIKQGIRSTYYVSDYLSNTPTTINKSRLRFGL
jgi:SAM-dependent methyltransferase